MSVLVRKQRLGECTDIVPTSKYIHVFILSTVPRNTPIFIEINNIIGQRFYYKSGVHQTDNKGCTGTRSNEQNVTVLYVTMYDAIDVKHLYDTIRYDTVYLTCSTKLTGSLLSPPHGTNKKLKCETKNKTTSMVRSSPIVIKAVR